MKVYFCYEYMKANDSMTPLRVKKIFKKRDDCFRYVAKKEAKEINRLSKKYSVDIWEHCNERIHELEVTE